MPGRAPHVALRVGFVTASPDVETTGVRLRRLGFEIVYEPASVIAPITSMAAALMSSPRVKYENRSGGSGRVSTWSAPGAGLRNFAQAAA